MAIDKEQNEEESKEPVENSDDSFGLPEIDYEPLKRETPPDEIIKEETVVSHTETSYPAQEPPLNIPPPPIQETPREEASEDGYYEPSYSYSYEEERPSIWPKLLGVILLLAIAGAGVWYFVSYRPKQLAIEAREKREKAAEAEAEQRRLAEEARRNDEASKTDETTPVAPATPPPGTIETLSGRTGRYYVVAASSIDGDLIMDYAKKLSAKGVTTKIIPPYGKVNFHRLTIAEGDNYADTQTTADGMKRGRIR